MNEKELELFKEFLEYKDNKSNNNKKKKKQNTKSKSKYTKRKDGRYQAQITIGFDEKGKRKVSYVYAYTINELEEKIRELKVEVGKGNDLSKRSMTLGVYANKWLEKKELSLRGIDSINTMKMYSFVIEKYIPDCLYNEPLINIASEDIQNIINENKSKARTCKIIKMVYKSIFKDAISERILYYNPVDNVKVPFYSAKEKRPLTDEEDLITEVTELTDRERAYIYIIKYAGLRREEALALKREDFDFENNKIFVSRAIAFDHNKPLIKSTKNYTKRIIPLLINIREYMRYYISNLSTDFLFTNIKNDHLITESSFKKMYASIMKKFKNEAASRCIEFGSDITSHTFRHNFACMLMHAGVEMKERQYLLGHKSIEVTMDIYTHIEQEKMKAPKRLEKYILDIKKSERIE